MLKTKKEMQEIILSLLSYSTLLLFTGVQTGKKEKSNCIKSSIFLNCL